MMWGTGSWSQLRLHWRSGVTGWREWKGCSSCGQIIETWNTCGPPNDSTPGWPSGHYSLDVLNFCLTYRPGTRNCKPYASRVFTKEETLNKVDTIIPEECIIGAVLWKIEEVKSAILNDPGPGNGPPGRLFVPEAVRPAVLKWAHTSHVTRAEPALWAF